MLETGRYSTINELAAAEKINSSYVSRLLRLTLLAPDIVEAILDGRRPEGMRCRGSWSRFRWSGGGSSVHCGEILHAIIDWLIWALGWQSPRPFRHSAAFSPAVARRGA
jgi:hypothetical protein